MTFGVALSFVLYAIAPSWPLILIGVVLMNFFNSIYQPALMAIISDSLPPERRGMGFSIIMMITSTSTTPGPLVAGFLKNQFGFENLLQMVPTDRHVISFSFPNLFGVQDGGKQSKHQNHNQNF